MKQSIIKILSVILAVVMLTGALSVSAFAKDDSDLITGTFRYMPAFVSSPATETFFYRDSYFDAPSTSPNAHLGSMSMALAYATMEEKGSSYIADLFEKIGFSDMAVEDMNKTPTKDTIGTAIARKHIGDSDVVAVSIRGNKYSAEWASNLTAGAQGDIEGMSTATQKVLSRVKQYLDARQLSHVKLWVAGYSRAGAIADLLGVAINKNQNDYPVKPEDLYVYCFEAPRCSSDDTIYPNIYCVKNKNDLINDVYPEKWGLYTNGVEVEVGETIYLNTVKIDLLSSDKFVTLGTVEMDEFNKEFIDFLAENLDRATFSGDFENAVTKLIELYFSKSDLEWAAMTAALSAALTKAQSNPRLMHILIEEVLQGVLKHNSDAMYRQLADEFEQLIRETVSARELFLTDAQYEQLLDSIYPLLRTLGPVLIKDYLYKEGVDDGLVLPEDYDDPNFDPQTADPPILTYDQSLDPALNPPEEETDASKGESDGRDLGYDDGCSDARASKEKRTEAPLPADAASRSNDYLEAFKLGYLDAYNSAYDMTIEGMNAPQRSESYKNGIEAGREKAKSDAAVDAREGSYKQHYDETPAQAPAADPDFLEGYRDGYREEYENTYSYMIGYLKELTFYHLGTEIENYRQLLTQHLPQTNWALTTAIDPYYNKNIHTLGDANGDENVSVLDATVIQRNIADLENETFVEDAADADSDGAVTVIDATYIQRYLAELSCPTGINCPIFPKS